MNRAIRTLLLSEWLTALCFGVNGRWYFILPVLFSLTLFYPLDLLSNSEHTYQGKQGSLKENAHGSREENRKPPSENQGTSLGRTESGQKQQCRAGDWRCCCHLEGGGMGQLVVLANAPPASQRNFENSKPISQRKLKLHDLQGLSGCRSTMDPWRAPELILPKFSILSHISYANWAVPLVDALPAALARTVKNQSQILPYAFPLPALNSG